MLLNDIQTIASISLMYFSICYEKTQMDTIKISLHLTLASVFNLNTPSTHLVLYGIIVYNCKRVMSYKPTVWYKPKKCVPLKVYCLCYFKAGFSPATAASGLFINDLTLHLDFCKAAL